MFYDNVKLKLENENITENGHTTLFYFENTGMLLFYDW